MVSLNELQTLADNVKNATLTYDHPVLTQKSLQENKRKTIQIEVIIPGDVSTETAVYVFRNTPDEFSYDKPNRATVTQTRGGFWVEDFGEGIQQIKIKGHTGYHKRRERGSTEVKDGKISIGELTDLFNRYNSERRALYNNNKPFRDVIMVFRMFSDDLHVIVQPMNITIRRSKSQPLLYQYDITFVVLKPYEEEFIDLNDEIMRMLNRPLSRLGKIAGNFNNSLSGIFNIISNNDLVNGLSDLAKSGLGGAVSLGDWLGEHTSGLSNAVSGILDGPAEILGGVSRFAGDAVFGVTDWALDVTGTGLNELGKIAGQIQLPDINIGGISLPWLDLATTERKADLLSPANERGFRFDWKAPDISTFVQVDMQALINDSIRLGEDGFELLHETRQLIACAQSLLRYSELFDDTLEDTINGAKVSLTDSGCATTLKE